MNTLATGPALGAPQDGILAWGIRVIEALQSGLPSWTEPVFVFFTLLGEPITYLVLIATLFWCVDERRAARTGIVLFVSAGINTALKETLAVPRPFIRKPGLNRIAETGFSTPSGHSQNSAAFWPVFLRPLANRQARIAASITLPFVIGVSRVYLGVHYPTDVLFGWTLGGAVSLCTLFALPQIAGKLSPALNARFPRLAVMPVSVKIAGVAAGVFILNAFSAGDTRMSGVLFGYAAGYLLLVDVSDDSKRFSAAAGSRAKKILRVILGFTGIAVLYLAGDAACALAGADNLAVCRFAQYALAGFWISRLAPELFIRTGLQ